MPGFILTLCYHKWVPKGKRRELTSISHTLFFQDLPRSPCPDCSDASLQSSSKCLKALTAALGYLKLLILGDSSRGSKKRAEPPNSITGKNKFRVNLFFSSQNGMRCLSCRHKVLILNICKMKEVVFLSAGNIWVKF